MIANVTSRGRVTFTDEGEGTNVYVGSAEPLTTEHFIAVVDPGLPKQLREALFEELPRIIDHLTLQLGTLRRKPILFASLDPHAPPGSGLMHPLILTNDCDHLRTSVFRTSGYRSIPAITTRFAPGQTTTIPLKF